MQQRIVAEANAGHDVAGAKSNLLRLGEVLVNGPVENKFANGLQRNELLGPNLGGIENVEVKVVLVLFSDNLDAKRPLRVSAVVDGLVQVFTVEVYEWAIQVSQQDEEERE